MRLLQERNGDAILDLQIWTDAAVNYQIMFRKLGEYYINIDVYIELFNNNNKKEEGSRGERRGGRGE